MSKTAKPAKSGSFVTFTNRDNAKESTFVNPGQVAAVERGPSGTTIFLTGGNAVHVAEEPAAVVAALG